MRNVTIQKAKSSFSLRNRGLFLFSLLVQASHSYAGDGSMMRDNHKVITETAKEAKENAETQAWVHTGAAAICTGLAVAKSFVVTQGLPDVICTIPAGSANLMTNEKADTVYKNAEGKVDEETKKQVQQGLAKSGFGESNFGKNAASAGQQQLENFIVRGGDTQGLLSQHGGRKLKIDDKTGKPLTDANGKETGELDEGNWGGDYGAGASLAASLLLPPEGAVTTLSPAAKQTISIIDKGSHLKIAEPYLRAAKQIAVTANEFALAPKWEKTEKDSKNNEQNWKTDNDDLLQQNKGNTVEFASQHNSKGSNGSSNKDSMNPCKKVTSAAQAVECMSQNAAIRRALNHPEFNSKFKEATGQNLKDFVGDFAMKTSKNPAAGLGAIAAIAQRDPNLNADQRSGLAQLLGKANDSLASAMEEQKSSIAMSKMGDKYHASNSIASKNGAGSSGHTPGLNIDMNSMFGDLFKNQDKSGKNSALGKLNFSAARKEKIPGYGPDAWENTEISIFERVETAYQETANQQGIDLNAWKLADNQKTVKAAARAPASQK